MKQKRPTPPNRTKVTTSLYHLSASYLATIGCIFAPDNGGIRLSLLGKFVLSRLVRNSGVILGSFPGPYRSHTTTGSLITSERLTVSIEVFVIQREHYNKKRGKCQPAKVPKSVGFYRFGRAWRYKTEGTCAEHTLAPLRA